MIEIHEVVIDDWVLGNFSICKLSLPKIYKIAVLWFIYLKDYTQKKMVYLKLVGNKELHTSK